MYSPALPELPFELHEGLGERGRLVGGDEELGNRLSAVAVGAEQPGSGDLQDSEWAGLIERADQRGIGVADRHHGAGLAPGEGLVPEALVLVLAEALLGVLLEGLVVGRVAVDQVIRSWLDVAEVLVGDAGLLEGLAGPQDGFRVMDDGILVAAFGDIELPLPVDAVGGGMPSCSWRMRLREFSFQRRCSPWFSPLLFISRPVLFRRGGAEAPHRGAAPRGSAGC